MIPFFRKTRKKLADDNKPMKYMRYAIGEIVLVMVGILLALQVNNWNEQRKIKAAEQLLLEDLKLELTSNIKALQITIKSHLNSLEATIELERIRKNPEELQNLHDSIIVNFFNRMNYNWTYNPKRGTLNSIISSGQINYINNKELKYLLTSIDDLTFDASESSNIIENSRSVLLDVVRKGSLVADENNVLIYKPKLIFKIPEFVIASKRLFIGTRKGGIDEEKELLEVLKKMVELIESELD